MKWRRQPYTLQPSPTSERAWIACRKWSWRAAYFGGDTWTLVRLGSGEGWNGAKRRDEKYRFFSVISCLTVTIPFDRAWSQELKNVLLFVPGTRRRPGTYRRRGVASPGEGVNAPQAWVAGRQQ